MSIREKKHKRKYIQFSDPGKLLELVMHLTDESCSGLQVRVNSYLKDECEAALVFAIVVQEERNESFVEAVGPIPLQRKVTVTLSEKMKLVLKSGAEQTDIAKNFTPELQVLLAPHLPKELDPNKRVVLELISGYTFCMIVCMLDPQILEERVEPIVHECFQYTWPTLQKTICLEYEQTLKQKCQQLLRIARRLFTKVGTLHILLKNVMEQAKFLTKAGHVSLMLVDADKMQLVDTYFPNPNTHEVQERRFPLDIGITGRMIKTGHVINSRNPQADPDFDASIDCRPDVECRSLICFPIRDASGIIGVGHLINKMGEPYFDSMDEEMALAFSIYCGICIVHAVVYNKLEEAHIRNTLANELAMYYMKVSDREMKGLLQCKGFHGHPQAAKIHFNTRALPYRELPCYVFKMFSDLGFDKKFNIPPHKLARFILYVKKGYRDVPYHNWFHAHNVAQWAYAAIINFKLVQHGYLTDLQALMYLLAALVHDLDHRGTTNSFQIEGQTALAALYSSEGSVMERHHLAQAICIINTEGCDVLGSLTRKDYDKALFMLKDYILATDLANYFKNIEEYKMISEDYLRGNRVHVSALQAMLMNAADLSDQLKDWASVKKTAAAVLTEFFREGDVEKSRGDLPMVMKDRDRCFIPELQINFLQNICVPLYTTLGNILPRLATCAGTLHEHIQMWENSKGVFSEVPITAGLTVLVSPELDDLIEQSIKEKERLRLEAEAAALAAALEDA